MRPTRLVVPGLLAAIAIAPAGAQQSVETGPGRGGSPHYKTTWTIDGANISISYGRPLLRGRPEEQLMPPGRPWRTGADTATRITSDKPLRFGDYTLPAGTHTINTQPGADGWQIIFGTMSSPGQWGVPYQANLELGRAPMRVSRATSSVEQLTIAIDDTPDGATLRVEWGMTRASVPFTVR